ARMHGCLPETIAAFQALLFNVRSRLRFSDFIHTCVIGPQPHEAQEREHWLMKTVAYAGGRRALDALVDAFQGTPVPQGAEDVSSFSQKAVLDAWRRKATIA